MSLTLIVRASSAKRDPKTQRYDDKLLAGYLQKATSVPAAAFKARGVPHVMRVIEILGIQQARKWGCASLNDFRRFLGLKPYATFEEWNPDKKIAAAAQKLYRSTENLELYVGLICEESKEPGPGAGLCPSFTVARAILADAVALVRGDRYLTYDCTPFNLTAFGFTEGSRNPNNAAHGGMLGRILQRGLPDQFPINSTYTNFPFLTPTGQKYSADNILKNNHVSELYSTEAPKWQLPVIVVNNSSTIVAALPCSPLTVRTPYLENINEVKLTKSFLSTIDDTATYDKTTELLRSQLLFPTSPQDPESSPGFHVLNHNLNWYFDRTIELVREKSLELSPTKSTVDIVKDVARLVPVHWVCTQVVSVKNHYNTSYIFRPH